MYSRVGSAAAIYDGAFGVVEWAVQKGRPVSSEHRANSTEAQAARKMDKMSKLRDFVEERNRTVSGE